MSSDQTSADRGVPVEGTDPRVADLERRLARAEQRYERLRRRKSVRIALAAAGGIGGLRRRFRRSSDGEAETKAVATGEQGMAERIAAQRPAPSRREGPLVSIVVLSRNGRHHLERLFAGLEERTAYRSFELIVVDNASTDGSDELYRAEWTFPLHVVRNERNVSFSTGCNQGVPASSGPLILLLNNDIDPITPGWLGEMVTVLEAEPDTAAAGALLVYPQRKVSPATDLTVQHRGIAFHWVRGVPWGYNLGSGEAADGEDLVAARSVPAVTAACMLVRRTVWDELEGLDERYVYGSEDVDFCVRLRQRGWDIRSVGAAALWHHEFGTQATTEQGAKLAAWRANFWRFAERWSPRLGRALDLDALRPANPAWRVSRSPVVAITLTRNDERAGFGDYYTAHELGDALEARGWSIHYAEQHGDRWHHLPADVSVVIGLIDGYDARTAPADALKIGWVRNWTDRWLDRPWIGAYDVLIPSSAPSHELLLAAGRTPQSPLPLATNPDRFAPGDPTPELAADYAFTGNYWGHRRGVIEDIVPAPGEVFAVYGRDWQAVPSIVPHWRGHLAYGDLPAAYRSAKIIIDDTAGPTLPYGAVNSRVFDAIAAGALVITDNRAGTDEVFAGLLPVYSDAGDLRSLLDRFLADPAARAELVGQLRQIVLDRHTYPRRAGELLDAARSAAESPRLAIRLPSLGELTPAMTVLADGLRRAGWRVSIEDRTAWQDPAAQRADVVLTTAPPPETAMPGGVVVGWGAAPVTGARVTVSAASLGIPETLFTSHDVDAATATRAAEAFVDVIGTIELGVVDPAALEP